MLADNQNQKPAKPGDTPRLRLAISVQTLGNKYARLQIEWHSPIAAVFPVCMQRTVAYTHLQNCMPFNDYSWVKIHFLTAEFHEWLKLALMNANSYENSKLRVLYGIKK